MLSKLGWRFLFCLIVAQVATAQEEKNNVVSPSRQSRLFYVTTQSTTSTLTTLTYCFVSSTTTLMTCGRRKRDLGPIGEDVEINPHRVDEASDLMPSEKTEPNERQGKFALYWLTTTSTSTSTAFSTTSTVASLTCTP